MRRYDDLYNRIQADLALNRGDEVVVVEEVVIIEDDEGYDESWEYSEDY